MSKPVHLLIGASEVEDIVSVTAIAVVDAQERGLPELDPEPAAALTAV